MGNIAQGLSILKKNIKIAPEKPGVYRFALEQIAGKTATDGLRNQPYGVYYC